MSALLLMPTPSDSFDFAELLVERYKPQAISEFAGLDKPKKMFAGFLKRPMASSWLFSGPSGTGKTTFALALASELRGELHHIPSQNCNVAEIERVRMRCQYVPAMGYRWHVVIVDEADRMSAAAQDALHSILDTTNRAPNTVWIFTTNFPESLKTSLLSRMVRVDFSSYGIAKDATALLERVWKAETDQPAPNLARIVKDANNNVREALNALESELLCVR